MTVEAKLGRIGSRAKETVVIGLFEDSKITERSQPAIEARLRKYLNDILKLGDFTGKKHQTSVLYPQAAAAPDRVILIGLGSKEAYSLDIARQAAGIAVRLASKCGAIQLTTGIHGLGIEGFSLEACAQATVEGTLLGNYKHNIFKSDDFGSKDISGLSVMYNQRNQAEDVANGAEAGRIIANGAIFARDLSNAPGNALPPKALANAANKMAKRCKLTCKILDKKAIEKVGMGALLAVNYGSEEPPRFIILEHGKASSKKDTIVLVGKGITFDSGGISIKPSANMEAMKHDMSGAAAVIGAMQAIGELNPAQHVVALVPSTENLPDGKAVKPGDVITALSGTTIEVINTDAEGRLVLADALTYAKRYNPAAVIDLATLTGACVIALGGAASGMMSNDEDLRRRVEQAGETSGERVWPLPLFEDYHDQIKSHVADIKNTGGRPAGALTAGAFLEKFVDYPWVHLDIAGTSDIEKQSPYCPVGATGVGARLLVQLVRDWGSK